MESGPRLGRSRYFRHGGSARGPALGLPLLLPLWAPPGRGHPAGWTVADILTQTVNTTQSQKASHRAKENHDCGQCPWPWRCARFQGLPLCGPGIPVKRRSRL